MKKILFYTFAIAGLMLTSCESDFDPQITGVLSPVNFPKTDKEFELYAMDCYRPFGSKWGYPGVSYENMFFSPEYGHLAMNDL
ncbi:MAG: RagB/SusD family nutrient uptake outer membrane protein, partial [Bacteroidales bacterium]|nr:RagB/SusD family nutrient uptake outer membrane protein [Bacteroidales bacterium]